MKLPDGSQDLVGIKHPGGGSNPLRPTAIAIITSLLTIVKQMTTLDVMDITATEAAKELGVTRQCVIINYLGSGQLRGQKVGGRWLIARRDLEKFKEMERPYGLNRRFRGKSRDRK